MVMLFPNCANSISNQIYQYGVCSFQSIFFYKKIAEFAIILELNGYSGCMEIG